MSITAYICCCWPKAIGKFTLNLHFYIRLGSSNPNSFVTKDSCWFAKCAHHATSVWLLQLSAKCCPTKLMVKVKHCSHCQIDLCLDTGITHKHLELEIIIPMYLIAMTLKTRGQGPYKCTVKVLFYLNYI